MRGSGAMTLTSSILAQGSPSRARDDDRRDRRIGMGVIIALIAFSLADCAHQTLQTDAHRLRLNTALLEVPSGDAGGGGVQSSSKSSQRARLSAAPLGPVTEPALTELAGPGAVNLVPIITVLADFNPDPLPLDPVAPGGDSTGPGGGSGGGGSNGGAGGGVPGGGGQIGPTSLDPLPDEPVPTPIPDRPSIIDPDTGFPTVEQPHPMDPDPVPGPGPAFPPTGPGPGGGPNACVGAACLFDPQKPIALSDTPPPGQPPPAASVPEPSVWVTLCFGFGLLGGLLRNQRRVASRRAAQPR